MEELKRKTYLEVNIKNIQTNVEKIITRYNGYETYFGVVKANSYGHGIENVVGAIIKGGCNYLAVATLEEALEIRKIYKKIPILILGIVDINLLEYCIEENITITISSIEYATKIVNIKDLKKHIKINTGMNRLGIKNINEVQEVCNILEDIEGIYSHIHSADNLEKYQKQLYLFEKVLELEECKDIKIKHISASESIVNYEKKNNINGCRLGIIMYGFTEVKMEPKSTFTLKSEVIQINKICKGESVGYNGEFVAQKDEYIAVLPIGYADGIIRKNTGRDVFINNKRYPIVGNICMDMLFVKVDETVSIQDKVLVIKDIEHIKEIAKYLETIPYEVLCQIGRRVNRIYR